MLGLDKGGSCRGSAYKLNRDDSIKNIDILFKREMVTGAYKPKLLKTKLDNDEIVLSLAFTVDKKHYLLACQRHHPWKTAFPCMLPFLAPAYAAGKLPARSRSPSRPPRPG